MDVNICRNLTKVVITHTPRTKENSKLERDLSSKDTSELPKTKFNVFL